MLKYMKHRLKHSGSAKDRHCLFERAKGTIKVVATWRQNKKLAQAALSCCRDLSCELYCCMAIPTEKLQRACLHPRCTYTPFILLSNEGEHYWEKLTLIFLAWRLWCVISLQDSQRTCCIPTDRQRQRSTGAYSVAMSINVTSCISCHCHHSVAFTSVIKAMTLAWPGLYMAHIYPLVRCVVYRYLWL